MKRSLTKFLLNRFSRRDSSVIDPPIRCAALAVAALLLPGPAGPMTPDAVAQSKEAATGTPLLPDTTEVRLARSAAPPEIASDADVWVLRSDGYERVRRGRNGYTCLVERDHPESLAPICYDPGATNTLLPGVLEIARLRADGLSYEQARDSVDALYTAGVLRTPSRPVLSFMLSREQRLYATPDGPPIGAWRPHLMIHYPGLRGEEMGLVDSPHAFVNHDGAPTSYLIVPVARWSDGTPVAGR